MWCDGNWRYVGWRRVMLIWHRNDSLQQQRKETLESLTAMIWLAQRGCRKMWLVSVKEWPPSISWMSWKRDKGDERENLQHEDILPDWTYNVCVLFCFHTVCVVYLFDCLIFSCSGLSYKGHKDWESPGFWFSFNRLWYDIKQLSMDLDASKRSIHMHDIFLFSLCD